MTEKDFLIKYNLQFFADDSGEKTEQPTARRKRKAREEGQVVQSPEVTTALLFIFVFIVLKAFASSMFDNMKIIFKICFSLISNLDNMNNEIYISKALGEVAIHGVKIIFPILASTFMIALLAGFAQVGWFPTLKPITPNFDKINPIKGLKNKFNKQVLIKLMMTLIKIAILIAIIYTTIKDEVDNVYAFANMEIMEVVKVIGNSIYLIGIKTGLFFIFVAAIDYFIKWRENNKNLMMTKQQIKEEWKDVEGNPEVKQKIKEKMQQASMRRMMQDVPKADVVITNPTHFAVALKYDAEKSKDAPVVVAKGADYVAFRIKEIAKENNVEIVENKPLARSLFATCEVGDKIPEDLYEPVALVLAYVFKLKNKF